MSKNILKAFGLSALMTSALVAGDCSVKSGAYAGISAGASHMGGKNSYSIVNPAAGAVTPSAKSNLSSTSALGSVFAGYGMKLSGFWAGLEFFYQLDNLKSNHKYTNDLGRATRSLNSKSNGAYGANLHLGILANDKTVAYLIGGIEVRRFKVKYVSDNLDGVVVSLNKGYTSVAFAPGVGVRFNIAKNLSLRTEYKFSMHKNKAMKASAANTALAGFSDSLTVKHKPQVHSFQIGAVYSF